MTEPVNSIVWCSQQRRTLSILVFVFAALLLVSLLRFVPRLDDALAGQPGIMRAIAHDVAQALAQTPYGSYPILFTDQTISCEPMQTQPPENSDLYFLISYSETGRSFCVAEFVGAGDQTANAITLTPDTGVNFGAPLGRYVRVIPILRWMKIYPDQSLRILHWRTKIDRSGPSIPFPSREVYSNSAPQVNPVDFEINIYRIRKEVARRHNVIDFALDCLLAGLAGAMAWQSRTLFGQYRLCRLRFREYGRSLTFSSFLVEDVEALYREAGAAFHQWHEQVQDRIRAQQSSIRHDRELRDRLGLLLTAADAEKREHIEDRLKHADLQTVEALIAELEAEPYHRSATERISLLLESLKEYCSNEEWLEHERVVREVLEREGYRRARELAIRLHEELREQSRQRKDAESSEIQS